jgi:hypothetical protein
MKKEQYDALMKKVFAAVPEDKFVGPFTIVVHLVDAEGTTRMIMSLKRFEEFRKSKFFKEVKNKASTVSSRRTIRRTTNKQNTK